MFVIVSGPLLAVEVIADETKAIDAVLKADTKRLALLEECRKLVDAGTNSDRLKEVGVFIFYCNCHRLFYFYYF